MKYLFLFLSFFLIQPSLASVQDVSQSAQQEVNVTLYNLELALIKERRKAFLKAGPNKLVIKGIPAEILVDTFVFQTLPPSSPIDVVEYTFQTPHLTREELLYHSIGETVHVLPSSASVPASAKLLALDEDYAIVGAQDFIFSVKKQRVGFPRIPFALVVEPQITLDIFTPQEGESSFELGYLAKGISWAATYTIVVDATEKHLDLNNWILIRNESGVDIKKGHFRIAHTQQESESFYEIEHPVSLVNQTSKNVSWFAARNLTPVKSFRIYPKNNMLHNEEGVVMKPPVETWLSVQNEKDKGLGVPLPEGTIRVFRRNADNSLFYVGENKTSRILLGKALSLRIGTTNEIQAEMRQTDYRKLGGQVVESGYRLDLKNTTAVPKQVTVYQNVSGEKNVLRETHAHEEEEKRIKWTIPLAPNEEVSLRYRIRMNME
jgi:hypothetical protein